MKTKLRLMLLPLLLVGTFAHAQKAPVTEFPADATPMSADAIKAAVVDKVLAAAPADGVTWRLEYKSSGYWFLNTSRGFSDTGKWRTQDGAICAAGARIPDACNEVRGVGDRLFLKRTSGEVVELTPK